MIKKLYSILSITLLNSIKILNDVLKNFSVNKSEMLNLANKGYITATDLADHLVKNLNYPLENLIK